MLIPKLIPTPKFKDKRGYVIDVSASSLLKNFFNKTKPQQTLISFSRKGVIRGLHCQVSSKQKKIITVIKGKILDVVVSINPRDKNYSKIFYFKMNYRHNHSLYIPEGYLHGYQVLSNDAILSYQITGKYEPNKALTVNPFDPKLNIKWMNLMNKTLSKKDINGISFDDLKEIPYDNN